MLLANKVCVITGAASRAASAGQSPRCSPSTAGARSSSISMPDRRQRAASELGEAHRGYRLRRHRQGGLHRRDRARGRRVRPGRRAGQQCRHHAAAEVHGHRARELRRGARRQSPRHALHEPGGDPADAQAALGLHRLHVVGLRPARRRHLRRSALQRRQGRRAGSRQGHGPRTGSGRHPRQLDHPRPDPDRHHRRQAHRRPQGRDPQGHSAQPPRRWRTMSPVPACSWPRTSPPTSPAPPSTSTAAC